MQKLRFARFDSPENGIRALAKLLLACRGKNGMSGVRSPGTDAVRKTIHSRAPGNENDIEAYIAAAANSLGVQPNQVIEIRLPRTLRGVVGARRRRSRSGACCRSAR
ncbi:hypothetical protein N5J43_20835 [Pseudomonas nicosulfuronedens]|uniref:Uncharacterized protein n=1 Tax=Pseudomonas nicosulfuronedens TaxID=2571105 RepID=A0A5R9R7S8_9PSED|nr:hypothetical protein [Pseudomonas nicosulfuronedens]MDH1012691.1 hypothetical protein [Pseudomonas nicosulfuronedens]MDH1981408.1 hypothetical protein [Pseudomonas nicosulfuronedens]MDH2029528.1 hypothetical protein [Pseudomonas nicosulfuronedens]TLX69745.1 hypothetical protein FAS41_30215 [Pseudomonas nicosulfuronedens]